MEGYVTISELAEKWNVSPRTVQIMCAEGRIQGATKFGKSWAIPSKVERPKDGRVITGEYRNWRKRKGAIRKVKGQSNDEHA